MWEENRGWKKACLVQDSFSWGCRRLCAGTGCHSSAPSSPHNGPEIGLLLGENCMAFYSSPGGCFSLSVGFPAILLCIYTHPASCTMSWLSVEVSSVMYSLIKPASVVRRFKNFIVFHNIYCNIIFHCQSLVISHLFLSQFICFLQ